MWASNPGTPEAQTRSTPRRGFQEMKIKCGHMVSPHPQDGDVCTTQLQADAGTSSFTSQRARLSAEINTANMLTLDVWIQSWKKTDFDVLAPWALENLLSGARVFCARLFCARRGVFGYPSV